MKQKLAYLHSNPVVSGFVEKEEEYLYRSAIDYYDGKGLVELIMIK
ncbi:MAG: hypothetical protein SFY32_02700 [Bacteroidota bacterium]|nr:hypothetical protein [Bacteroidota bacterium]